jgi:hypothetical protein
MSEVPIETMGWHATSPAARRGPETQGVVNMVRTLMTLSLTFVFGLSTAGCATATVRVRQDDGTYRTSQKLVWWSSDSYRSFTCKDDYMVATMMSDVTYEWPTGKGHFPDNETMTFEGDGMRCEVRQRTLTINDRRYREFEKGDRVRITPDARVLVNGVEQPAADVL